MNYVLRAAENPVIDVDINEEEDEDNETSCGLIDSILRPETDPIEGHPVTISDDEDDEDDADDEDDEDDEDEDHDTICSWLIDNILRPEKEPIEGPVCTSFMLDNLRLFIEIIN